MNKELEYIAEQECVWRNICAKQDNGSYCENASKQAVEADKIMRLYRDLFDALLAYERIYGIKADEREASE